MTKVDNKVLDVSPSVKWIGILDFDIVTFDIVMETEYGTTYNSYFIDADKKAIVETSKARFWETYQEKVKSVVDPAEIEYIILDHTEPDHSGNLSKLLEIAPNATVVGSGNALRYLEDIVFKPFKSLKVKDGDTLDLGNKTLKFIGAPNLHWPDSIYTYLEEEQILFTCDSFGAHFCNENMFDDLVGNYDDAFNYYFDVILKPFSKFMLKAICKIEDLEIKAICPGHGPILRTTWKDAVDRSRKLSQEYLAATDNSRKNVLIAYVSAYGYTKEMARAISEGIKSSGKYDVQLLDVETAEIGDIDMALTQSDALLVGTPTINQNTLLPIYKMFAVINPLRDKGKPAATFGSYGWSGEAAQIVADTLKNLKLKIVLDSKIEKFNVSENKFETFKAFGADFAKSLEA